MPAMIHDAATAISKVILQSTMEEHFDLLMLMARGFYQLGHATAEGAGKKEAIDLARQILESIVPEQIFKQKFEAALSSDARELDEHLFENMDDIRRVYRESGLLKNLLLFKRVIYSEDLIREHELLEERLDSNRKFKAGEISEATYNRLKISDEEFLEKQADLIARAAYQRTNMVCTQIREQFDKVFGTVLNREEALAHLDPRLIAFLSSLQSAFTELTLVSVDQVVFSVAQEMHAREKASPQSAVQAFVGRVFIDKVKENYKRVVADRVAIEKQHLTSIIQGFQHVHTVDSPLVPDESTNTIPGGPIPTVVVTPAAPMEVKRQSEAAMQSVEGISSADLAQLNKIFSALDYDHQLTRDISRSRLGTKSHEVHKWTSLVIAVNALRNMSLEGDRQKAVKTFIELNREKVEQVLSRFTVVEKVKNDFVKGKDGAIIVRRMNIQDLYKGMVSDEAFAQLITNVLSDRIRKLDSTVDPIGYNDILKSLKEGSLAKLLSTTLNNCLQIKVPEIEIRGALADPSVFGKSFVTGLSKREKTRSEKIKAGMAEAVLKSDDGISAIADVVADITGISIKTADLRILMYGENEQEAIRAVGRICQDMFGIQIPEKELLDAQHRRWEYLCEKIQQEAGITLDPKRLEALWNIRKDAVAFQKGIVAFVKESNLLGQMFGSPKLVSFGKKWITKALQKAGFPPIPGLEKLPENTSINDFLWQHLKVYDPTLKKEEILGLLTNPPALMGRLLTIQTQWTSIAFSKEEIESITTAPDMLRRLEEVMTERVLSQVGGVFSEVLNTPYSNDQTRSQLQELVMLGKQWQAANSGKSVEFETTPDFVRRFLSAQPALVQSISKAQPHLTQVLLSYNTDAMREYLQSDAQFNGLFPNVLSEIEPVLATKDPKALEQFLEGHPEVFIYLLEQVPEVNDRLLEVQNGIVPCSAWGQMEAAFAPWLSHQSVTDRFNYEAEEESNNILLGLCEQIDDFIDHQAWLGEESQMLIDYRNKMEVDIRNIREIEEQQAKIAEEYRRCYQKDPKDKKLLTLKAEGEALIKEKFERMEEIYQSALALSKVTNSQRNCYLLAVVNYSLNHVRDLRIGLAAVRGAVKSLALQTRSPFSETGHPVHNNMMGQFARFLVQQKSHTTVTALSAFCQSSTKEGRTLDHLRAPIVIPPEEVGWLQELMNQLMEYLQWMLGMNETPKATASTSTKEAQTPSEPIATPKRQAHHHRFRSTMRFSQGMAKPEGVETLPKHPKHPKKPRPTSSAAG